MICWHAGEAMEEEAAASTGDESDPDAGSSSAEASRIRREAKVAESAFMADTSAITEGPVALYRKGLQEYLFRPVRCQLN